MLILCDKCKREFEESDGEYDSDGDYICPSCQIDNIDNDIEVGEITEDDDYF